MRVLDLFSGIGGFSLGLERAGMRTVAFCEIEPYCRSILRRHWPGVPIFEDVCTLDPSGLGQIDLICGGFPCQDISVAGKGKGLEGERSGLWFEMLRLVHQCRPNWVLIENVPRLRTLGADRVLSDLEEGGYTARPLVVEAQHTGARHKRARVWIVANSDSLELRLKSGRRQRQGGEGSPFAGVNGSARSSADTHGLETQRSSIAWEERRSWPDESAVLGVDDGIPDWMDRKCALGNAVVPQIPEIIGRAIMKAERSQPTSKAEST